MALCASCLEETGSLLGVTWWLSVSKEILVFADAVGSSRFARYECCVGAKLPAMVTIDVEHIWVLSAA